MARLPIIGSDAGAWGAVLNEFLEVAHDTDGTLKNIIDVADYGATGDGVVDDTAELAAAITAAGSTHVLVSAPDKTYLISGTLTVPANQRWNFNGSTIKKAASMTTNIAAVILSGGNYIEQLSLDGNLSAGTAGPGLQCGGASNVVKDCYSAHSKYNAFYVPSGDTTFINCVAEDVQDGFEVGGSASGFIGATGLMRCFDCRAYACERGGFTAFSEDNIFNNCYATRCGYGLGVPVAGANDNGHIGYMLCEDNEHADFYFEGANGWGIDYAESRDAGLTDTTSEASAFQLNNCDNFSIGTLVALRPAGYGLALAGGSSYNRVGALLQDSTGGFESDPGLHFSGGALNNFVGEAYVRGATIACIIGEGTTGNNDNHVGVLHASDCTYGALWMHGGTFNYFGRIISRNSYTTSATYTGLLDFSTADATDNVVGFIDHRATGETPKYVVHFDANAVRNYVMDGFDRGDYDTADVLDSNGGNFVSPALGSAGTLRS